MSGQKPGLSGLAEIPSEPLLQPTSVADNPNPFFDAEVKLLEALVARTHPKSVGVASLYVTKQPCTSCGLVIGQSKALRPGIALGVRYG